MYKNEVILKNETGLHARPANLFAKEASKYKSEIIIKKDEKEYNAKSIIGILSMGAGEGSKITIIAEGEDEIKAVEKLTELVESKFVE